MLAAAAFIIFFVVVGGSVLFFAFGGGPKGAAEQLASGGQSRAGRRFTGVIITALVLAFGVAIPVFALTHNNRSQSKQASGGLELSKSQQKGRVLFAHNCATCHTLDAANAVGKVGTNLDQLRPPAALVTNAVENGRARGNGQMPAGLLSGNDVKLVASFVAAAAGR